jgi:hypothetical protein
MIGPGAMLRAPLGLLVALPSVALLSVAPLAHAEATRPPPAPADEPPDPAVQEAADANLESTENRQGLTFSASFGGGLIVGFGINDSVGRGPSVSLRLGHVATRTTVITFELDVTTALHKPPGMDSTTQPNTNTNLLAGALHYVGPSLWLRFAGGLGVYDGRQVTLSNGQIGDTTLVGPAVLGGVGVDLARFKSAVLGLEVGTSAMINRDGLLVASGLNLGLAFD